MDKVVIIGAGPAGLAAAHAAGQRGLPCLVVEKSRQVGGLSRTVEHRAFRFDIGPHRFFTKNRQVQQLWEETLGVEFLAVPRLTRIYSQGRFFLYPLKLGDVLAGLGPWASAQAVLSYLRQRAWPDGGGSYAGWITRQFGRTLYDQFFRDYTAKVWGVSGEGLSSDWAAQRLRNLSLWRAILSALRSQENGQVVSLVEQFRYPRLGAGQMYEALATGIKQQGADIALGAGVAVLRHSRGRITSVVCTGADGFHEIPASHVIASMPITDLVQRLQPRPPDQVLQAARQLSYRSLVTVNLLLRRPPALADQWIYLQSPAVKAGRLHIAGNFSPAMAPPGLGSATLEYFCSDGDELWGAADSSLVEIAKADLEITGLIPPYDVLDGLVLRVEKAYPVYRNGYAQHLAVLRDYLAGFANLHCIGRFGQFRYNNMDHAMLTGLLAVRRLLGEGVDPWAVNAEAEYHEELSRPDGARAFPWAGPAGVLPIPQGERPCAAS